jgi:putative zinc finger/helix-turn-helix YgiT family protein
MSAEKLGNGQAEDNEALCPQCGEPRLESVQVEETFDHGGRKKPIRVTARLSVKRCRNCAFVFEDWQTERARHRAACAQVGVQSPDEIRSIRNSYELSQKEFARLTRLGAATLNRWERGHLIQNGAYDDYLYLLRFPENLERLKDRRRPGGQADNKRFPNLQLTAEKRRQANRFRLTSASRPAAGEDALGCEEPAEATADSPAVE